MIGLGCDSVWQYTPALLLLGVLCAVGMFNKSWSERYIPLEISYAGQTLAVTALVDTGNLLTDPLTGRQVLVLSPYIACKITNLTQQQLRMPLDTIRTANIPGLRLIPYRTIGQHGLFLLALKMRVKMNGQTEDFLVAFAPDGFAEEGAFQALTGGMV